MKVRVIDFLERRHTYSDPLDLTVTSSSSLPLPSINLHIYLFLLSSYFHIRTQDDDALSIYKIQSSHTIHMVKGAARSANPSSSTSSTAAPQQLPTMQAGQNVHDPLTQLNSHLGYGAMAGLNPFADMGVNPNDPNMVRCCFFLLSSTLCLPSCSMS